MYQWSGERSRTTQPQWKGVLTYILSTDELASNTQMGPSIRSSSLTLSGGKTNKKKQHQQNNREEREGRERRLFILKVLQQTAVFQELSFHVFQAATSQHGEHHQGKQG